MNKPFERALCIASSCLVVLSAACGDQPTLSESEQAESVVAQSIVGRWHHGPPPPLAMILSAAHCTEDNDVLQGRSPNDLVFTDGNGKVWEVWYHLEHDDHEWLPQPAPNTGVLPVHDLVALYATPVDPANTRIGPVPELGDLDASEPSPCEATDDCARVRFARAIRR